MSASLPHRAVEVAGVSLDRAGELRILQPPPGVPWCPYCSNPPRTMVHHDGDKCPHEPRQHHPLGIWFCLGCGYQYGPDKPTDVGHPCLATPAINAPLRPAP